MQNCDLEDLQLHCSVSIIKIRGALIVALCVAVFLGI